MSEETNNGRRRIVVRRKRSSDSTGNGTGTSSDGGTTDTSTVNSGNSDNTERITSDGIADNGSDTDDGGSESSGSDSTTGSDSQRIRGRRNAGGYDDGATLDFGSTDGTDPDSSGDSDRKRGEGKPKRTYRKRQTAKTSLAVEQDTEDVKNIVVAVGDAFSNATGYDGFKVYEPEALTIAKPAARILQRHGAIAETIRTVADPLSLLIATATVFGPRIAAYSAYKRMGQPSHETVYERVEPEIREQRTANTAPSADTSLKPDPTLFAQFQD